MNSFSFNRFWKVLSWDFGMNRRGLLLWTIGYSIAVFLGEMMFFYLSIGHDTESILNNIVQFCMIFIMIALAVGLSVIFYDMNKKPRRQAFLMLPASNLEKFLAAVLYCTVGWAFCVFFSYAVGDTLRMVVRSLAYGDPWISSIPMYLEHIDSGFGDDIFHWHTLHYQVMSITVVTAFLVWLHSLYIFGGTLLRRYAFVVVSVFFIVCLIAFAWIIHHFSFSMFYSNWVGDHYERQEVGTMAYVLAVLLPLLSACNYWASFHIFKGFQLITNKWTNYDLFKR